MSDSMAPMAKIRRVAKCSSWEPYTVFEIPSQSQKGVFYDVYSVFPEDPVEEYICVCRGFCYRGRCVHQELAFNDRCLWDESSGPEEQTEEQKMKSLCPRCGGPTTHELEVVDE